MDIVEFLKKVEGFSAVSYECAGGYKTIGYGHKLQLSEKWKTIDPVQAEFLLREDIYIIEKGIERLIKVPLSSCQKIALTSFTFNVGTGALQRSRVRSNINREEHASIPEEMAKWVYAGGKIVKGLVYRRVLEGRLYMADSL